MVDDLYDRLGLSSVIGPMKSKGADIDALVRALLAYKLGDNHSIQRAGKWINCPAVLDHYGLDGFNTRALNRTVELLGQHREKIIVALQDAMLRMLDLPNTDVLLDWTSVVVWGRDVSYAKFGHSKGEHPEEQQINIGVAQLAPPWNLPIALTVQAGNVNDQDHFRPTYMQARRVLREGSLVTFDNGAASLKNIGQIELDHNQYLTRRQLNKSDDAVFASLGGDGWELVDEEDVMFVKTRIFPSRVNFYFRSGKLEQNHFDSLRREAEKDLEEAKAIQRSIENNKGLPKSFRLDNPLVEMEYYYQTKLVCMSDEAAIKFLMEKKNKHREGCFSLTTNRLDMTAEEALRLYRAKDAIEKLFHSLKGDIEIGPLRVQTDEAVHGVVLLSFIAQVMVCLTRILVEPVRHMSTKFIVASLQSLTLTVELLVDGRKRRVYSNFDRINIAILAQYMVEVAA
jgi:transposase